MKRRVFVKTLGLVLSNCYCPIKNGFPEQRVPISVLQNNSLHRPRSIKVVGIGDHSYSLTEDLQENLKRGKIQHDVDFIIIQDNSGNHISCTDIITLPIAINKNTLGHTVMGKTLTNVIQKVLSGAELILLIVSLDSDFAFTVCDEVAKLARNSGAFTVVQVGTPLVDTCEGLVLDGKNVVQTAAAIARLEQESDCFYTGFDYWLPSLSETDTSEWYWGASIIQSLIDAARYSSDDEFHKLRTLFKQVGEARLGIGIFEQNIDDLVEQALDPRWNRSSRAGEIMHTASIGFIVVHSHPQSIDHALNSVKAVINRNSPLKSTGKPYWRDDSEFVFLPMINQRYEPEQDHLVEILSANRYETSKGSTSAGVF